jgi:hypothetical protein
MALLSGDQSTALALALTTHFFNYLSTGIVGLIALSNEGETLMGIYHQLRNRQASLQGPEKNNETFPGTENNATEAVSPQSGKLENTSTGEVGNRSMLKPPQDNQSKR